MGVVFRAMDHGSSEPDPGDCTWSSKGGETRVNSTNIRLTGFALSFCLCFCFFMLMKW
jgi:hypothetical protein